MENVTAITVDFETRIILLFKIVFTLIHIYEILFE